MKVAAFGVPVFTADGNSRSPVVLIQEINTKLEAQGIDAENVINISVEQDFYHVFYRK